MAATVRTGRDCASGSGRVLRAELARFAAGGGWARVAAGHCGAMKLLRRQHHRAAELARPDLDHVHLSTGPLRFASAGSPACGACGVAAGEPSAGCTDEHGPEAGAWARRAFLAAVDSAAHLELAGKARHWSAWTLTRTYGSHEATVPLSLVGFRGVVDLVESAACGLPYTATVEAGALGIRATVVREVGEPIVLTLAPAFDDRQSRVGALR